MRTSPVHYIDPSAISIVPNCNGSANDLAVTISRNAKIKVYSPRAGIDKTTSGEYQEWTLTGRNRRLANSEVPYTIYARLNTTNKNDGYLVFAPMRAEEGGEYMGAWTQKYSWPTADIKEPYGFYTFGRGSDWEEQRTQINYIHIRLGDVSLPDANNQRTVTLDTGILGTDRFNDEWALRPDELPLRIELGCTINDEDAGATPYVYWGQSLVLTAMLTEGWTGTDIQRFDCWEIVRNSGDAEADNAWNYQQAAGQDTLTPRLMPDGQITLQHIFGGTDDFNGAVSVTFTILAVGHTADTLQREILRTATLNIMAETVATYELEQSTAAVTYNPLDNTYSPAHIVVFRIRAKAQDGSVSIADDSHIAAAKLHLYALPEGNAAESRTSLTFTDGIATLPVTAFAAGKSINLWLENGAQIVLARTTVAYIRYGEKGDTPISIYRWYKVGVTPLKPASTSSEEPAPAAGDATGAANVYPTGKWSKTATDRPATGEWALWMCGSIRHGNGVIDAWSTPVRISGDKGTAGEDGSDREYIYIRLQTFPFSGTLPSNISDGSIPDPDNEGQRKSSTDKTKNDWVPAGWSDTALPADNDNRYVYMSVREKPAGENQAWGQFGNPVLWSNWGVRGTDGDGVEYVYVRTTTNVAPTVNSNSADSAGRSYTADEYLPKATGGSLGTAGAQCTDDPVGTDASHPFEWVAKRSKAAPNAQTGVRQWEKYSGTMALWSNFAKSITKIGESYRYATNTSGTRPAATSSDWRTTRPTLSKGYWLFTETTISWSDGSKTVLYTDERNPNDGVPGQDIIVDGATVVKYYVGNSNTDHPAEDSPDWQDISQVTQTQGMWLWSKATTYYRKAASAADSHDAGSSTNYNVSYIAKDALPGRSIVSITEYYKATESSDAMDVPTSDSGWDIDPNLSNLTQKWGLKYRYLWNYEKVIYSSGTTEERTKPQLMAIWTKDGATGKGVDAITNYYKISNQADGIVRPSVDGTDGWDDSPIAPTADDPYLWNYERITWLNSDGKKSDTYVEPQMIGHFGKDGNDAQAIAVTGSAHDAGTATAQVPRSIVVNGENICANRQTRGLVVVTISRTTLMKVAEHCYDTYGDATGAATVLYEGGCSAMVSFLSSLDDTVFVAAASFDACGWTAALVDKLKEFGLGTLPYSDNAQTRTPFAFFGYKGLAEGYALMVQHAPGAYTHVAKVGAYIVDGTFMSSRDGRSLVVVTEHYTANNMASGMQAPADLEHDWAPVVPDTWGENAIYLWNYERMQWRESDGATTYTRTTPHKAAIWTKDGRGIVSIVDYYMSSTRSTGVTVGGPHPQGETWTTEVQQATPEMPYLWNYELITFTEQDEEGNTTQVIPPHVIGHYGKDATLAVIADIDNEMDAVVCDADGHPVSQQTIETNVALYHGSEQIAITGIYVYDDDASGTPYEDGTARGGIEADFTTSGHIEITFDTNAVIDGKKTFCIQIENRTDVDEEREVYLTVSGVRPGDNGEPATVFQLVPSAAQVAHRKDDTYNTAKVTCDYTKNVGGTFMTPSGAAIMVKLDGGPETPYNSEGYTPGSSFSSQVEFLLYVGGVGGTLADRETVPVVEDGTDGDNAETFSIETSESEVHYDGDGVLTTGFIDVRGYRCVGQGERTLVAGNAAMAVAGPHYYCAYSMDGGSTWTACAKKNMAHAWLGIPVAAVEQVTSADKLRIRLQYATSATKSVSTDMVVMERDPLPVHYDGTDGGNGKDAADVQPNLLRQTLFEEGKDDLWVRQFGTKTLVAGTDGRGAMQVTPTGSSTTYGNCYQNVAAVLAAGTDYTISFWAKSSAPFFLYIDGLNSSGGTANAVWFDNSVTPTGNGGTISRNTAYAFVSMVIPTTTEWKRYELHVRTAASLSSVAAVRLSFRTYKAGQTVGGVALSADSTALICMPKLERGTTATAYMPHETEMQGNDGYSITLSPPVVIIEQATEQNQQGDYPLDLSNAYTILRVMKGGVPVGATVTAVNDGRCAHVLTQEGTGLWSIGITSVGVDTNTWYTDAEGDKVNSYWLEGCITLSVTPQGETQATTLYFDFHCNLKGVFSRQIKGDVETSVASKITSAIQDGSVTTLKEVGTYIRSASQSVSRLQQAVGQHTTAISEIEQTVDRINLSVFEIADFDVNNYDDGPFWVNGGMTSIEVLASEVMGGGVLDLMIDMNFENVEDELSSRKISMYLRRYTSATGYSQQLLGTVTKEDFADEYAYKEFSVRIPELAAGNYNKIALVAVSTFTGDCEAEYNGKYRLPTGAGLVRTGIDIENRKITAQADNFEIWNNAKTKKTFSIDQDGNLMSAGDAYIGGTIRAQNFFHNVCIFNGDATSSAYSYQRCYVPQNYSVAWDNETAEGAENAPYRGQEGQYVEAEENAQCLVPCTYDADIILSTIYTRGKTVHIPKASDFVGKCIEIYNISANTENYIYIRQAPDYTSDGNTFVYGTPFVYGWNNGDWNNNSDSVQLMGSHKVVLYSYRARYEAGAVWLRLGTFTITNN